MTKTAMETDPLIKPLSLPATIALFAVPTTVFCLSLLVLEPALVRRDYSLFEVFNFTFVPPLALLLIAAFAGLKLEGRALTWPAIRDRFRLGRLPRYGWLWVLGLCAFNLLASPLLFAALKSPPAELRIFKWPAEFALLMGAMANTRTEFLGIPLAGQWWVLFYYLTFLLVFNILGEELWWRGYILPRQEVSQGSWAWPIHGVLWDLFHCFYHQTVWSFVVHLPVTLSIAFVCQRLKNTWPGIISHAVLNGLVVILILRGILS